MLSWARHIGALFTVNLPYRATAISYSLVVQRIKDLNHLFVTADILSVRVYLSFRALYAGFMPLSCSRAERDASRHYEADFICCRAYVVPLHNNSLPSGRSVDYRHSIDRRLHRQPSPPRSPRDRSSAEDPLVFAAIHPSSRECGALFPLATFPAVRHGYRYEET